LRLDSEPARFGDDRPENESAGNWVEACSADKALPELGVLLFPDPRPPYATDPPATAPTREEVNQLASANALRNPGTVSQISKRGRGRVKILSSIDKVPISSLVATV